MAADMYDNGDDRDDEVDDDQCCKGGGPMAVGVTADVASVVAVTATGVTTGAVWRRLAGRYPGGLVLYRGCEVVSNSITFVFLTFCMKPIPVDSHQRL